MSLEHNQGAMKTEPSTTEYDAFKALLNKLVAVPKEDILRREAEYKAKADQNPKKRGPKRKV